MAKLLFIEDEAYEMRGVLKTLQRRHELVLRSDGASALRELRTDKTYDLVILDLMLPRGNPEIKEDEVPPMPPEKVGEYVFERMGALCPNTPVIILTAARCDMSGIRQAASAVLIPKPVVMAQLLHQIDILLPAPAKTT